MVNYIAQQCLQRVVNGQERTCTSRSIPNSTLDSEMTFAEWTYFHQVRHFCTLLRSSEKLPHGLMSQGPWHLHKTITVHILS